MEMANSIASMATSMKASQLQQNVQTSVLKKTMDTQQQLGAGIVNMLNEMPKFSGENGFLFDAIA